LLFSQIGEALAGIFFNFFVAFSSVQPQQRPPLMQLPSLLTVQLQQYLLAHLVSTVLLADQHVLFSSLVMMLVPRSHEYNQ
jgi:hypothetical protein